ncbi:MAG: bifunctional folylpolyglutamate synthase/dihydrofolate synthase [Phycisphaeraceae bacterium]|nr:bifunctional folylpolyglutamate synthase/dihydrofolate synthase [Phycisphaeraceae bacterium]
MTRASPSSRRSLRLTSSETGQIKDLASALSYLDGLVNFERSRVLPDERAFKLDRMRSFSAALGNPERDTRFVHVAGSKGKGSVCEMLASCLASCRYGVGLFTSPHLIDVRERVRVGGRPIGEDDFVRLARRAAAACEEVPQDLGRPTYFEHLTAIALMHFAELAVDLAVLEVGLGGRLDSTNIVTPDVCAITAIQLEHTQVLGDTVEKIAAEKAGIIKPGVPVLTVAHPDGVMDVIRARAEEVGAPLYVLGRDIEYSARFESSADLGPHVRVCVATDRFRYEHLAVPLKGQHQAENCGLVLAILERLRDRGIEATEPDVARGLAATPVSGRLELALDSPRIYIDGAHTPESVEAVVRALGAHVRSDSTVVVFGCAADKNIDQMLSRIGVGADKIVFTRSSNPRAVPSETLLRRYAELTGRTAQATDNVREAINLAARAVGQGDLMLITGSFYLAGEAKRLILERASRTR